MVKISIKYILLLTIFLIPGILYSENGDGTDIAPDSEVNIEKSDENINTDSKNEISEDDAADKKEEENTEKSDESDEKEDKPEETEKETTPEEKEKADNKINDKPEKKGDRIYDPSRGLLISAGIGALIPVADFGNDYNAGFLLSLGVGLYQFNLWGFSPEVHVRYSVLSSKEDEDFEASIMLVQMSLGIIYSFETRLPSFLYKYSFFKNPITIYGRITEGISMWNYERENPDPRKIVEYINTLGLSTGFTYPIYKNISAGIDLGYQVIFTKYVYFQDVSVSLMFGMKI